MTSVPDRGRRLWTAILLVAAAATVAAGPADGQEESPASFEERRLVGDWEQPDAFLLARQPLWDEAVDQLLEVLLPYPVYLVSRPTAWRRLPERPGLQLLEMEHESAWVRDYGPLQAHDHGRLLWLDADYHSDRPGDDAVPDVLAQALGVRVERLTVRLDGGAVASDGRGLCVMTNASLEGLGTAEPRGVADRIGCQALVVIPALANEPTGHADLIVHFLGPHKVGVAELPADSKPSQDAIRLDVAATRIDRAVSKLERQLEVVRVPAHLDSEGRFYSYLNVVPLDARLLVPEYEAVPQRVQKAAYEALRHGSGKRLVPVSADAIALGGGGLHCVVLGLHRTGPVGPSPEETPAEPGMGRSGRSVRRSSPSIPGDHLTSGRGLDRVTHEHP